MHRHYPRVDRRSGRVGGSGRLLGVSSATTLIATVVTALATGITTLATLVAIALIGLLTTLETTGTTLEAALTGRLASHLCGGVAQEGPISSSCISTTVRWEPSCA